MADQATRTDGDLLAALVKCARGYRDRVSVFRTVQPSPQQSITHARRLLALIWPQFGDCSPFLNINNGLTTQIRLANEGRVDVFHPSAAIAASMRPRSAHSPLAQNEQKFNRQPLLDIVTNLAHKLAPSSVNAKDELRFESTWEWKAKGQSIAPAEKGSTFSPTALFDFLAAYRRYIDDLPVLGRASIHVALGGGQVVTRWGVDWRAIHPEPFTQTPVLDPREGAQRVLDDLHWRRPERPFSLKDFEPQSFELGYLSLSRSRRQFVMQPAWVAILKPRSPMTTGHVIAVPAAPAAFEPFSAPLPPPSSMSA